MRLPRRPAVAAILILGLTLPASAHVKWFAPWSFTDRPMPLGEILSPLFFALLGLTLAGLLIAVYLDRRLSQNAAYRQIVVWFDSRR